MHLGYGTKRSTGTQSTRRVDCLRIDRGGGGRGVEEKKRKVVGAVEGGGARETRAKELFAKHAIWHSVHGGGRECACARIGSVRMGGGPC